MMSFGDLTTLAQVRAWLQTGQQPYPATDDALLTRLITAASQYIQAWLNRTLAQQDWLEIRDGTGGCQMNFGAYPVSQVLALSIDGIALPAVPEQQARGWTSGYSFSPTQLVLRGYLFTRRPQNVAITYTAGYANVPAELAQACNELVALRYRERTRIGEVSKSLGSGETVAYSQKDMSAAILTILSQYRRVAPVGVLMPAPTQTDMATLVSAA